MWRWCCRRCTPVELHSHLDAPRPAGCQESAGSLFLAVVLPIPLPPVVSAYLLAHSCCCLRHPSPSQVVDDSKSNKLLLVMDYLEGGPVMTREGLGEWGAGGVQGE